MPRPDDAIRPIFNLQRVFYLITVMLFVQIEPLLNMMVVVSDDESLPELKYL